MGNHNKRRDGRSSHGKEGRSGEWFDTSNATNQVMQSYYKEQGILADHELEDMWSWYRKPLPSTFRLSKTTSQSEDLAKAIREDFIPHLPVVDVEGDRIGPPKEISWYPDGYAWQLNVNKTVMRKNPEHRKFKDFLVYETEVGNISRSEAVSMIPPLFLDPQPDHWVLDMCAAPGSKTSQLIEALHTKSVNSDSLRSPSSSSSSKRLPKGFVIANDSDYKRSHMLVHQAARLSSPCLMVTNWDASHFPNFKYKDPNGDYKKVSYDRVLCDVPCSGDGTIRKNPMIWKKWTVADGNGLHSLQLKIALRGLQLLKPGGRLVYSTCSMNPVENEAVVAALLKASEGTAHLIDVSELLSDLVRRPGLSSWKVCSKKGQWVNSPEDIEDPELRKKTPSTMWPPEQVSDLNLERCLRIYPQLQNSGGFFVAVIQKHEHEMIGGTISTPPLSEALEAREAITGSKSNSALALDANEDKTLEDTIQGTIQNVDGSQDSPSVTLPLTANSAESVPKKRANGTDSKIRDEIQIKKARLTTDSASTPPQPSQGQYHEDPYTFVESKHQELAKIQTYFHLPEFPIGNLFARNAEGDPKRLLSLTNDAVKNVMQSNSAQKMRLINAGVKAFGRQDVDRGFDCQWRLLGDGLEIVMPYVDKEVASRTGIFLEADLNDLEMLLRWQYPKFEDMSEQIRHQLEKAPMGCCLIQVAAGSYIPLAGSALPSQAAERIQMLRHPLTLPLWRSKVSCNLTVHKNEKAALSRRLFGHDLVASPRLDSDRLAGPNDKGRILDATLAPAEKAVVGETDTGDSVINVEFPNGDEISTEP